MPLTSFLKYVHILTISHSNINSCQLQKCPSSQMSRFKTEGWVHFEGMDTLFSSDLAHRSCSYHPVAAGTNACSVSTPGPSHTIPSISANISTAPPSTSDISITSNISHVSLGISGVPPSVSDTISSTPGVLGISAGPGIPEPSPFYPNYGTHMSSSSHMSSNLVMTPSTSPAHLRYPTPFIGSPTSTVAQGEMPEKVAFLHGVCWLMTVSVLWINN